MTSKNTLKSTKVSESETAYDKCLSWFYAFPISRISLTDLARSIHSSKTSTKQAVGALTKEGFLFKEVIGKAWLLSAKPKHAYLIAQKMPYHLKKIYASGIVDAVRKSVPQSRAIILFGSYRWASDNEKSDIDIAVEVLGNQELAITRLGVIQEVGYRKNVPVNLHVFSRKNIDLNLFSNIANGIVLDGFLEVRS